MKRNSLKTRLQNYLEKNSGWHASGQLQRLAMDNGYTAQTAGRLLRKLAEEETIRVDYMGNRNHAHYRAKAPKSTVVYTVAGREVLKVNKY